MQIYLEIINTDENGLMVVKDEVENEAEALSRYDLLYSSTYSDTNFVKRVHFCKHDEKNPCLIEELELEMPGMGF